MVEPCRSVLVKVVLMATSIYTLMALDLLKWVIESFDKMYRGYLCCDMPSANVVSCHIASAGVSSHLAGWAYYLESACSQ